MESIILWATKDAGCWDNLAPVSTINSSFSVGFRFKYFLIFHLSGGETLAWNHAKGTVSKTFTSPVGLKALEICDLKLWNKGTRKGTFIVYPVYRHLFWSKASWSSFLLQNLCDDFASMSSLPWQCGSSHFDSWGSCKDCGSLHHSRRSRWIWKRLCWVLWLTVSSECLIITVDVWKHSAKPDSQPPDRSQKWCSSWGGGPLKNDPYGRQSW